MKKLILIVGAILSAQAFACPDLSGTYQDKNGESVVLAQRGCDEVSVLSRPLTHTLLLDNVFTVVQDDNDITAFGRGIFEGEIMLYVNDTRHLEQLIEKLRGVEGVEKVSRFDSKE